MSYNFTPNGGEEPWGVCCKRCRLPIFPEQESKDVRFSAESDCEEMSGTYHAECAQPYASIAHALDMLSRFPF